MTQSDEQGSSADAEGSSSREPVSKWSSPKAGRSGGFVDPFGRPWGFAGLVLAVGAACWFGAHQVKALTDNPLRLDVFFHLFWVQEMPGVLIYFLVAAGALGLSFVLPASWAQAVPLWVEKRRFLVCALVLTALAAGSVSVYRAYPVSMDEFTAVQQSEIFSRLRLGGSYPPQLFERLIPEFFLGYFFTPSASGEFVSNYWPGHSLLMAPFSLISAPWLLNPLLAALSLLLVGFAVRKTVELEDRGPLKAGAAAVTRPEMVGWAMLFMLASPEFVANGMSFYSMNAHLFFNLGFALMLRRPTDLRVWAAGLVGGMALVLHQPVPHALFALPWALWMLCSPLRWRRLGLLALGYVPIFLFLGVGWFAYRTQLQTEPLPQQMEATPYEEQAPQAEAGERATLEAVSPGADEAAGVIESLKKLVGSTVQVPTRFSLWTRMLGYAKLVLWTMPGLPILAVMGFWAIRRRRHVHVPTRAECDDVDVPAEFAPLPGDTWLQLLAASAGTTVLFYFFVSFSQGHGWGFRYFFPAWAALPLLAAAAVGALPSGVRWRRLLLGLVIASLLCGTGLRSLQIRSFIDRQMSQIPPVPELKAGERAVQFMHPHRGFFRADLIRNDPFLLDPVLRFVSVDLESDERLVRQVFPTAKLVATYGEETVWVVPATDRQRPVAPEVLGPKVSPPSHGQPRGAGQSRGSGP